MFVILFIYFDRFFPFIFYLRFRQKREDGGPSSLALMSRQLLGGLWCPP